MPSNRPRGQGTVDLVAPGHPLLQAVIEATIEDLGATLTRGTVLVDRREKQVAAPLLMYTVEQRITNATAAADTVSHHFDYPLLAEEGTITVTPVPPYLDYDRPQPDEIDALAAIISNGWARENHDRIVRARVYHDGLQPRLEEIQARLDVEVARTREQVRERLLAEINHWDREHSRLQALERQGTIGRIRAEAAHAKARQLDERLDRRLRELDETRNLVPVPPVIRGMALVVPSALLASGHSQSPRAFARHVEEVERRAVEAVLAAERALGRDPVEMARNNPGYDVRSTDPGGRIHYIEVKGRIAGSDTFTVTANEVTFAGTQGERHRLALVEVSPEGPEYDRVCYVLGAFEHLEASATTRAYNEEWRYYWNRGGPPT